MPRDKQAVYSELLVLRCQRGQREAWGELVRHWERRLFYYIRRLVDTEEDAWDALQDTWLKALRGIRALREPRALPLWLYRIARCTAMSRLRAAYADPVALADGREIPDDDAGLEPFRLEEAERVHHGLARLSLPHREVLTLRFLEDLSVHEIAEVLDVPPGTVKSRLHYAKRALRAALEAEERAP